MGTTFSEITVRHEKGRTGYYGKIDPRYVSEFLPNQTESVEQSGKQHEMSGQYDTAIICTALKNAITRAYDSLKNSLTLDFKFAFTILVDYFNSEFKKLIDHDSRETEFFAEISEIALEGIHNLEELRAYDLEILTDLDKADTSKYVDSLISSYSAVVNTFLEKKLLYVPELADRYLNSFFELSRGMVFTTNSLSLTSTGFRKSFFLRTLLSFASKREQWTVQPDPNEKITNIPKGKEKIFFYYFCYFDPFAYDSIERSLVCATKIILDECRKYGSNSAAEFFELRKQMFMCSMESAFQRNITLENESYRIELNRHTSHLCAYPVEAYSSTSGTKPIRLFEKTASYICHNLPNGKKLFKVVVTVIGHTGSSNAARERSIADYLAEVLTWYDDLSKKHDGEKLPSLRLEVQNVLNLLYKPEPEGKDFRDQLGPDNGIMIGLNEHTASCKFRLLDYESHFAYSLKSIKEYIDHSHVLFLLDCPWLSTENYSIREEGALGNYCAKLQKQQRDYRAADPFWVEDSKHYYESSPMVELSNQFNRIMSSSSRNAGPVVRSMRDDLIRAIQDYMMGKLRKETPKEPSKELYVFSSENDGINYSYIDSYSLTRLEQYDGKHFTIIQFSNKKLPMLRCKEGPIQFEIDLWSVLKYLCIPYSYQYAVKKLLIENGFCLRDSKVDVGLQVPIQYLEILQNIVINFQVSQNMRDINISIGFTQLFFTRLGECFPLKDNEVDGKAVQKAKENIEQCVLDLIKPLYLESVFAKNTKYGDDAIKLGFKMTLYSAAHDVNTMLFCHVYREACERNDFSHFNTKVEKLKKEASRSKPRDFSGALFFADKKLYSYLLDTFENDYSLSLGMVRMLRESQELFELTDKNRSVLWILLDNIKLACEQAGLEDSRLYLNLLRARYNLEV